MDNKENLREIVDLIKEKTGKTQQDIAVEMGYKRNYISEILSPKGVVTEKFYNALKLRFSELLNAKVKVKNVIVHEGPDRKSVV